MSSLAIVFNDRHPHLIRGSNGDTWDYGRGLLIATAKPLADGSIGSFRLENIALPAATGNPQDPINAWSRATPSALYANDGINPTKIHIASLNSTGLGGCFYTLSSGFGLESYERITGLASNGPVHLSWWGMKANIAFRTNVGNPGHTCVAQRNGPNAQHPTWGNWEILTIRSSNGPGGSLGQAPLLDLNDNILCFQCTGGAGPTDELNCHVSIISSEDYPRTQDDANIRWDNYVLQGVKLHYAPAPLYTDDGSNKVFVFCAGTDGYLWIVIFKVDDNGLPVELSNDKSAITVEARRIPGTGNRITSAPSPVLYENRIYVFFRDQSSQMQYVFGDISGVKWSVGSNTNIMLPVEEVPAHPTQRNNNPWPFQAIGGVSAFVIDDSFL